MNCEWLKISSRYDCVPVRSIHGEDGVEIGTPFSFADGTAIVVYAFKQNERILFSDNGDALSHLSSLGLPMSPARVAKIRERVQHFGLTLTADGDVRALVPQSQGAHVLAQTISGLLSIADWERDALGIEAEVADLADQAEIYLREWKPHVPLERGPKIKGQSKREHRFDFLLGNEYIDVIPANHTATGATMRKTGDVKNSPYLDGRDIRIVVDDRFAPAKAEAERQILGSLVKAMTMTKLIELSAAQRGRLQ